MAAQWVDAATYLEALDDAMWDQAERSRSWRRAVAMEPAFEQLPLVEPGVTQCERCGVEYVMGHGCQGCRRQRERVRSQVRRAGRRR